MSYEDIDSDDLTLRDKLARDRTIMANERTLLAYARTAIMLAVTSVSLIKLFPTNEFITWAGAIMIPLSITIALLGMRRYVLLSRSLRAMRS